jgi:predicted PurR-regulated permease PerM
MLGLDARVARYTWTAAAVLLLLAIVYLARRTLFIFILAVLFAYMLSPLVDLLDRLTPGKPRTLALALAYVILVLVIVILGVWIGTHVVAETDTLTKKLPGLLSSLEHKPSPAPVSPEAQSLRIELLDRVRTIVQQRAGDIFGLLQRAGFSVLKASKNFIYIVVIPILAFFFLKDGWMIRDHILEVVGDSAQRLQLQNVMADLDRLLARYMRALLTLSLASFTAYSLSLLILRVPYAVLLAALAAVLEFIPVVGPLTAAVLIIAVAGLSGSHIIAVLIFLGLYRLFQDYILNPNLMSSGTQLHPLVVIFGVFAGAEIGGIPGAFLSVPTMALLRIVYRRIVAPHTVTGSA